MPVIWHATIVILLYLRIAGRLSSASHCSSLPQTAESADDHRQWTHNDRDGGFHHTDNVVHEVEPFDSDIGIDWRPATAYICISEFFQSFNHPWKYINT